MMERPMSAVFLLFTGHGAGITNIAVLYHQNPMAIRKKGKFHVHGANSLKTYRRRLTDLQVWTRAEIARQASLRNRSEAELAFEEILKSLGLRDGEHYVREKIYTNGDRHIRIDFLVGKIGLEVDGRQHLLQEEYDTGRTQWLDETKGITVYRFPNPEVIKTPEIVKEKLKEILKDELQKIFSERQAGDTSGSGSMPEQSTLDQPHHEHTQSDTGRNRELAKEI